MNSLLPLEIRGTNAQLVSLSKDNFQHRKLSGSKTVPFSPETLQKAKGSFISLFFSGFFRASVFLQACRGLATSFHFGAFEPRFHKTDVLSVMGIYILKKFRPYNASGFSLILTFQGGK